MGTNLDKLIRKDNFNLIPSEAVYAIGKFDGFHRGHEFIINRVKELSRYYQSKGVLLSFTPNPKLFFDREFKPIMGEGEKYYYVKKRDMDLYFLDFYSFFEVEGDVFYKDFFMKILKPKALVVGENFHFGKNRSMGVDFLRTNLDKDSCKLEVARSVLYKDKVIASSLIREYLTLGDLDIAKELMGHPYFIIETVKHGYKKGKGLGFPTINFDIGNNILPKGIYLTKVEYKDKIYKSLSYIGEAPTFNRNKIMIETYILNFDKDLYGVEVKVMFYKRIREDKKFSSKHLLTEQLKKDLEVCNLTKY